MFRGNGCQERWQIGFFGVLNSPRRTWERAGRGHFIKSQMDRHFCSNFCKSFKEPNSFVSKFGDSTSFLKIHAKGTPTRDD